MTCVKVCLPHCFCGRTHEMQSACVFLWLPQYFTKNFPRKLIKTSQKKRENQNQNKSNSMKAKQFFGEKCNFTKNNTEWNSGKIFAVVNAQKLYLAKEKNIKLIFKLKFKVLNYFLWVWKKEMASGAMQAQCIKNAKITFFYGSMVLRRKTSQ